MSSGDAVQAFALPAGGWEVFCLEHGGQLSQWTAAELAEEAAARHRRLAHE